ncbi:hypothetical protein V6N13_078855 [Hibiscus sabdariffa]|uniref:Uncharacterized protein n=1 Tax=Hibiscus sabdariffa TaxID=183260 RepID=A0ABR2RPL4_9ROSI
MVSVELLSPRNEVAQVVKSRALEDVQSMGLNEMVVELPKPFEPTKIKSSWEATVDALNNAHLATVESIDLHELSGTLKESEGFFPELVTKNRRVKNIDWGSGSLSSNLKGFKGLNDWDFDLVLTS